MRKWRFWVLSLADTQQLLRTSRMYVGRKFYSKLWTLRHLRRSKVPPKKLVAVFECYMRLTIEYCSVVYGPLLSEKESAKIENLQRNALRIIYGYKLSYKKLLEKSGLVTLKTHREEALQKFAVKTVKNARFTDRWFALNNCTNTMSLRNQQKYRIERSNFERMNKSPLNEIRKYLNEINENPPTNSNGMHQTTFKNLLNTAI